MVCVNLPYVTLQKMDSFYKDLTVEVLDSFKKKELIEVANHYELELPANASKADIKKTI